MTTNTLTGRQLKHDRVVVAYLILAHGNPDQLTRLVNSLASSSPVLIHFDRRADQEIYEQTISMVGNRPGLTFVDRHACRWGNIGIVQGTVSLIQALAGGNQYFDYAILLSGADYPIKSNSEIAAYLTLNRGKEFIESFSLMKPNRWSNLGGNYKTPEKVLARHVRFRSRVWRIPGLRRPPMGMEIYGGSQWWCLSADAIRYISDFSKRTPAFMSYFAQSFIPDESFIQTILSNSPLADRLTGDDLRLTIWDRPNPPYPATLTVDDAAFLFSSKKLFARKFDPRLDERILDLIDERNVAQDSQTPPPASS